MSNEAIVYQDDVSADLALTADKTPEQSEPREPTEREKRMAEIARQVEEVNGIKRDEPVNEDEPLVDESFTEQPKADPLKDLGYYLNDSGTLVTKMKISGQEVEVRADQVKAYIQKDLAGDQKLQAAAERERRLAERENLIQQREAQIQQSLSQRPSKMDAEKAKEQAKAVLEQLWDGDQDKAADALVDFMQRGNPTVDTDQIMRAAEQTALTAMERREQAKIQEQWQRSVDDGNRFLSEKHPEIYADQRLFDLVNGETERMVQALRSGDPEFSNLTPKDIIAKAAESVQGWMDGRTQKKPEVTTREERKTNLQRIPNGLNTTQKPQKKTELDMSPAAVIDRMKRGRAASNF